MAANSTSFASLKSQLLKGTPAPVYLLHGEEGYFIDELVKAAESIIAEADRDFDLCNIYAPQSTVASVLDAVHRYPFMSPRQVVILREAQAWSLTDLKKLKDYFQSPSPSTVLVVAYRGEALKGVELPNAVKKGGGEVFESKKLGDSALTMVISDFIKERGLSSDPKALSMLTEFVGSDLSRLYNEIDKLTVTLGPGAMVTPEAVERNIGISHEYNNFEFISAIASRNFEKATKIVDYFARNPRKHPVQMLTPLMFNLFTNLLVAKYAADKSERGLMAALGFKWPGQMTDINRGLRAYSAGDVVKILEAIRVFDGQSKGNGSRMDGHELLQVLTFRILTMGR